MSRNAPTQVFICLLVALILPGHAVSGDENRHFLWSVETRGNAIYLLGSMHVLKKEMYPLNAVIEGAYRASSSVAFETDIEKLGDPEIQQHMMQLGLYPAPRTLRESISKETYALLEKKISAMGLPIEPFNRLRPWLLGLTLSMMELQRLGYHPEHGVDRYFFRKAKQDQKSMVFFETAREQLDLFAGLSEHDQELMLLQTLKELEVIEKLASEMARAWLMGDVSGLESIVKISFQGYPGIYERLITGRNRNWLPKIAGLLEHGEKALIVVGAGHLVGGEGLPALLRKMGYRVTQR